MPLSHAQHCEDLRLAACFGERPQGFYIDVGAGEPKADSVTQAFYERGWRGINVEPSTGPYSRLKDARPEDINLNMAVGADVGQSTFYVVGDETGLSTTVPALADAHAADGWTKREITVPLRAS